MTPRNRHMTPRELARELLTAREPLGIVNLFGETVTETEGYEVPGFGPHFRLPLDAPEPIVRANVDTLERLIRSLREQDITNRRLLAYNGVEDAQRHVQVSILMHTRSVARARGILNHQPFIWDWNHQAYILLPGYLK